MITRIFKLDTVAALALTLFPLHAFAHASLLNAVPSVGGVLASSPNVIRLNFSEHIVPNFSGIMLSKEKEKISTGPSKTDGTDKSALVVKVLNPLAPGTYEVAWHAISVDTHRTEGNFQFSVK